MKMNRITGYLKMPDKKIIIALAAAAIIILACLIASDAKSVLIAILAAAGTTSIFILGIYFAVKEKNCEKRKKMTVWIRRKRDVTYQVTVERDENYFYSPFNNERRSKGRFKDLDYFKETLGHALDYDAFSAEKKRLELFDRIREIRYVELEYEQHKYKIPIRSESKWWYTPFSTTARFISFELAKEEVEKLIRESDEEIINELILKKEIMKQ